MEEESVDKIMNDIESNPLILDDRKVIIKRSQSVAKLRENIKHVCHISNLNFKTKENDLKNFFISNGITEDSITDILIIKDDEGKSKGFGFVEFKNEVY
jgi:RNA recognition motif-containing protein